MVDFWLQSEGVHTLVVGSHVFGLNVIFNNKKTLMLLHCLGLFSWIGITQFVHYKKRSNFWQFYLHYGLSSGRLGQAREEILKLKLLTAIAMHMYTSPIHDPIGSFSTPAMAFCVPIECVSSKLKPNGVRLIRRTPAMALRAALWTKQAEPLSKKEILMSGGRLDWTRCTSRK